MVDMTQGERERERARTGESDEIREIRMHIREMENSVRERRDLQLNGQFYKGPERSCLFLSAG
jgi:hypothetical protein